MNRKLILTAALLSGALALSACNGVATTAVTPPSVCQNVMAIAQIPAVADVLSRQDPHGTVGVLWADVQAGCAAASTADPSWTGMVFGMLKAAIPQFLPQLVPLLIGLL